MVAERSILLNSKRMKIAFFRNYHIGFLFHGKFILVVVITIILRFSSRTLLTASDVTLLPPLSEMKQALR